MPLPCNLQKNLSRVTAPFGSDLDASGILEELRDEKRLITKRLTALTTGFSWFWIHPRVHCQFFFQV